MDSTQGWARVPEGRRVYAIGDIHGSLDLLERLLGVVWRDSVARPGPKNLLVFLGDYVDRGSASAAVLDRVIESLPGFETLRLLGNHELMMRDVLDGKAEWLGTWMDNGGDATLRSYGLDGAPTSMLARAARDKVPARHRALLEALSPSHHEGDYFFAHAGIRPGVPFEAQTLEDLVWIRKPFLDATGDFGKVVVHGHSVAREVVMTSNRIGVDTGAYRSGILSAVVLQGAERRVLQVAAAPSRQ